MVFRININDLLKRYGYSVVIKELSIHYDNTSNNAICEGLLNGNKSLIDDFVEKHGDIVIDIDDDMLSLMSLANKMVKDKINCTNRHRNRFYTLKHNVIKRLLEFNLVNEIVDNGNYYLFRINGYEFHQSKDYFRNVNIVTDKKEEYKPVKSEVVFDYNKYKLAMATMAYFVTTFNLIRKKSPSFRWEQFTKTNNMKVNEVEKYRTGLIEMLHQLTDEQIRFFKRLWANNNMDISIEEAVDNLDINKLSIVYNQAKNTIKK